MEEFIQYLLKGLACVTEIFSGMTFYIYSVTFSLTDLLIYSGIITFTLNIVNKISSSGVLNKGKMPKTRMKGAK